MINKIPTVLVDYAVYLDNVRLIGTGEVTLPTLAHQTAEVSGAGIGGTLEVPVLGHYDSMTLDIAFRTIESDMAELMKPEAHKLVIRASVQSFDGAGGRLETAPLVVYATVMPKQPELGRLKAGEGMDTKISLEVLRIRVVHGGDELLEIDKLNGICRYLGEDYGAGVRFDLGLWPTI